MTPHDDPVPVPSPVEPEAPQTNGNSEKQTQYASIIPEGERRLELQHTLSSMSHDGMAHATHVVTGDSDEVYNKFSDRRKIVIVAAMSFCSFLAPISSTTVLSAVPEVAATFNTDGSIINVSNALYMLFMGISPLFYGPYGNIYGRKWVGNRGSIGIFLRLTLSSGISRKRSAVHCLLYWNRFGAQPGILFRL